MKVFLSLAIKNALVASDCFTTPAHSNAVCYVSDRAAVENENTSVDKNVCDNGWKISSSWNVSWVRQAWNMKPIKSSERLATLKLKGKEGECADN